MQSLPLANIHQGFLKVLQIVFGKVVLVASLAVDRPLGEWLRVNIKFAQAVDYDVGVNVACAVFTIGVGTDQSLMPGKLAFVYSMPMACAHSPVRLWSVLSFGSWLIM